MSSSSLSSCFLAVLCICGAAAADEPPPATAPDTDKLEYLFESWRGKSEQTLKAVWGREETLQERETTRTYLFVRQKRSPAVGFGGVTVIGREMITCNAYFQVALEGVVTRATWRGTSADDCWDLFRDSAPLPDDGEEP